MSILEPYTQCNHDFNGKMLVHMEAQYPQNKASVTHQIVVTSVPHQKSYRLKFNMLFADFANLKLFCSKSISLSEFNTYPL